MSVKIMTKEEKIELYSSKIDKDIVYFEDNTIRIDDRVTLKELKEIVKILEESLKG
jgi:hypothetical protein